MAGNQIYFNDIEIYNRNNHATHLLWEKLSNLITTRGLQENLELINFLDSINQDKYGCGTITSHIEKIFAPRSKNLLVLHKLLEEMIESLTKTTSITWGYLSFYSSLSKSVLKIYEGKNIYRMKNFPLELFHNNIKNNILSKSIVHKKEFDEFLSNIISKDNITTHYIDFDDFFEPGSQDLLIFGNILDTCISELVTEKKYSEEYSDAYTKALYQYKETILNLYYAKEKSRL